MQLPHGPSLLTHPDTVNHCRAAALITDNDLPPFLFHLFFLLSLLFLLIRSHKAVITEADLTEPKPPPSERPRSFDFSPRDESQEFAPPPTLPTSLRCCRAFDPSAAFAAVGVSPPARLKHFKRLCLHSRMENFDLTRLAAPFCTFDTTPCLL